MQIHIEQAKDRTTISSGVHSFEVSSSLFRSSLRALPQISSEEEFCRWFQEISYKVGKNYALRLLSRQSYHSKKISRKLSMQGILQETIDLLIEELKKGGYLQDRDYVERWIQAHIKKGWGKTAILAKLRMQGFNVQEADRLIDRLLPFEEQQKMMEKEIERLCRKGFSREKTIRSLQRKGFSLDLILAQFDLSSIRRTYLFEKGLHASRGLGD